MYRISYLENVIRQRPYTTAAIIGMTVLTGLTAENAVNGDVAGLATGAVFMSVALGAVYVKYFR